MSGRLIKYERRVITIPHRPEREKIVQDYLDRIIFDGYEIISYNEEMSDDCLIITLLLGKRNQ